jgi:hypothetical protein
MNFRSLKCRITVGGIRSWGNRGSESIRRKETCQRELRLHNHLNPNFV